MQYRYGTLVGICRSACLLIGTPKSWSSLLLCVAIAILERTTSSDDSSRKAIGGEETSVR